tara:strand:- start:43 stop:189 length:147 start_codon:yes stop_codon:yes gene_type:complete
MRFFKKEGNIKFRKTTDTKLIEKWLKDGCVEVNSSGVEVVKSKSKKDK